MSDIFPDFDTRVQARREAAAQSLRSISHDELTVLGQKLFPEIDHPWQELYDAAVTNPIINCHAGEVGDEVAFLYSPTTKKGLWYRTKDPRGMGPIQERGLRVLAELIAEQ